MRFVDTGGSLRGILSDDYDLINIDEEPDNEDNEKNENPDLFFDWKKEISNYVKRKN